MRKIVPYDNSFDEIVQNANFLGCETSPMIGGDRYIGFGYTKFGYGPACILDIKETPYVVEPHVIWFPWTSPRERINAFKWAMEYLGRNKQVLIIVMKACNNLHEHFAKKGFLRKIGTINNLPEEAGEEIHMYQYVRENV